MKLTDTQKKFRKEMRDMKNVPSPYDGGRDGNPFHKTKKSIVFPILLFLVLSTGYYYKFVLHNKNSPVLAPISVVNTQIHNQKPLNDKRSISKSDSIFLNELDKSRQAVGAVLKEISDQHRIPWEKRDISTYKSHLLEGIVICDKEKEKISSLRSSSSFEPLKQLTIDYINFSGKACKSYLDYVNEKKTSDLEIGNKYLISSNESVEKYLPTFIEVLTKNNYDFIKNEDGGIRYSVSEI